MSPKSRFFSCCILAGLMLAGCSWETTLYDTFVDADGDLNHCPPKNVTTDAPLAYINTQDCTKATLSSCEEDYSDAFEFGICPAKFSLCSQDSEQNWFCQKVSCAEGQVLCVKGNGNRYCADPLSKDTCGITSNCDDGMKCGASQECRFLDAENKYDCLCPADSLKCDNECLHPESKSSCGASCVNHAGKVCSDEESCVKDSDGNYDCILGCAEGQFRCYDNSGKQYCADPQSMNSCGITEDCTGGNKCDDNQHCGLDEATNTYQCKIGCAEEQYLCLNPDGKQYCADPTSTSYCGITEACNDGVKCGEQQICAAVDTAANKWSCKCPSENALTCGTECLYPGEKATCGATCDNPKGTACTDKHVCEKLENNSYKCSLVCGDNQLRCDDIDQCLNPSDKKTCGATCDNPEGTPCTENESCVEDDSGTFSCRLGCAEGQFQCIMPEKDDEGNDKLDEDGNVITQKICVDPKSKEYCGMQPDCTSFVTCGADQSCSAVKVKGEDDVEKEAYVCTCPEGQTTCGTRCVNPGANDTCGITCDEKSTGDICDASELFFCQTKTTGTDDEVTTTYSCECYTGYDKVIKIVEEAQTQSETNDEPVTPAVEIAVCINPMTDKDYCGASHVACGEGQFCANGECKCTNGGYICNGKCVLPKDHDSCNIDETCMNGIRCKDNESCVLTTDHYECLLTKCEDAQNLCVTDNSRECIDKTDLNHCGTCTNDCAKQAGEGQIVKSCSKPQSGLSNDYICEYECDADNHYAQCGSNNECVNLYTDINNCGECGKQCTDTNICINGECKDNECEGNQCQFDTIEGSPICVSVSVACGRTCDNCKAKGQVCNEEGICAGEVQCLEGTHPVFDENNRANRCEENTDYKCAPKDSKYGDPLVDCTKLLPENGKWVKCVGDGECQITCNINFVLNDKNECICPEDYETDEAGNCVEIKYVTDCVAERYPANYHVSEDRRSCVPNSNDACAANTWDGEGGYTNYVQSCADPLVCKDDGTCKCPKDNYELNDMNLCIPSKCMEATGHDYITSYDLENNTCKINSCGNGFSPSDKYYGYYHSCKCNYTTCGNQCVNTKTDVNNCGSCGNKCPDTFSCNNGICTCPENMTLNNGKCYCGNNICGENEFCNSSKYCLPNCCSNASNKGNIYQAECTTGNKCKAIGCKTGYEPASNQTYCGSSGCSNDNDCPTGLYRTCYDRDYCVPKAESCSQLINGIACKKSNDSLGSCQDGQCK